MPIPTTTGGGFGVPKMYEVCERLRVWYTFGIGMNSRLKQESDELLAQAVERYEQTHEPQRLFTALSYQAQTWDRARSVVIKAECHAAGTNRRGVVTNRPGALIVPQGVYDDYIQRGESENRNKELKVDLCGGRLSDHPPKAQNRMANLFRLCLHALALNLLIRLRSELPDPPDPDEPPRGPRLRPAPVPDAEAPRSPTGAELRRAQPATWRLRNDQSGRRSHRQRPPRAGPPEFGLAQPAHLATCPANGEALLTVPTTVATAPVRQSHQPGEGEPPAPTSPSQLTITATAQTRE